MDQLKKGQLIQTTGIKGETICKVEPRITNGGDDIVIELLYEGSNESYGALIIPKSAVPALAKTLLRISGDE